MIALNRNISYTDTSIKNSPSKRISYVELFARSNFSFLQGASHPEEMVIQAQRLGYTGVGICDLNGLYGVVRGFATIEHPSQFTLEETPLNKINYHIGTELWVFDHDNKPFSISLLPINKEGYFNLCKLITLSKRRSPKGFASLNLSDLAEHSDELIAFPWSPWSEKTLLYLQEIFGSYIYLPVYKDYSWESIESFKEASRLEGKFKIPIVATQKPLMHARARKPLLDILTCILHKTSLKEAKTRLTLNAERYLKPLNELSQLWSDRPDALERTLEIRRRIHFSLHELKYQYPKALSQNEDPAKVLREITERGLRKRFPKGISDQVRKMVEHELSLIKELHYEDYFLTLWDVCQFANKQGILHQGRGSAANSVVCYALELTAVDPTQVELLFERFISKERGEPPDIDIDFESERREEVIQYIYNKYGHEHAAMVCTVITYRSRLAIRDCAKTLSIPLEKVNILVKHMGKEGLESLSSQPQLADFVGLSQKQYQLLLKATSALKGFPRHLGIHTGGFLISQRPIFECVPVEKATMNQRYVIQWNKDDLTTLKMLKIDVLGLGMLGALRKCFELLNKHEHLNADLYNLPSGDKKTYDMIQKADTIGTFQIESRAQMSLLPRLKPKNFYDLVIEVAIVRPGPLQGGMVHPYIRRRHNQEKVTYPHEALIPILKKTHGVPIFQEQIMQIASSVCGFTPGESDELRRIMSSSWQKSDLMQGLRKRIISGMIENKIEAKYAEQIYQTIVGFASYGFPESHAASFALLTYASCYIKCHYPDVFVTSLLNSQPMGFYSPRALIEDAKRHRVQFLDLDIQKSDFDYGIQQRPQVRVGFRSVFGLKKEEALKIIEERDLNGEFKDLKDLVQRTRVSKRTLLLLAAAGAFRCFHLSAREALWKVQSLTMNPQSLFWGEGLDQQKELLPKESEEDVLKRQYQSCGFSIHKHPMDLYRVQLNNSSEKFLTSHQLDQLPGGRKIHIAGLMALHQRPPTAKGFSFLTMEDETGTFNVILTPQVYEKHRLDLIFYPMLKIYGTLEKRHGVINIKADQLKPL